jgi:succinate-acetate transporter protein
VESSTLTAATNIEVVREVPVVARATGDPQVLGWIAFVAGSVCLGLQLVGYVPQGLLGAPLPIIFAATGLGLFVSAVWAAYLGQTFVAGAFGLFAGFWLSYSALVLGLQHNWFLIPAESVTNTAVAFLIAWAVAISILTVATLRLPALYTIEVALIDAALIILAVANNSGSTGMTKVGGVVVFSFAALGAYIWLSVADQSLGGPGYPVGRPLKS